ncbi:unnamed protein product [Rotaria sp. Silwood1]|nr:unnamed protein product [Rotaria sp. Silwood1]CAF1475549.1 unnamed protein product [Rotaria sp. Silwood1]CAF3547507.1 unnamed protein product [Rotaria sp. Silwood1]CAF3610812.1 unnamed protein product [Rotaria sp. Silwood1]CAF4909440.1 unnamed protein product [Rotaria sp. Silwood1]
MDVEYTVTEIVHRNRFGETLKIEFQFDECTTMSSVPTLSGLTRHNKEKRYRSYEWSITRDQYQSLISKLGRPIGFDAFVDAIRPIIMGYYKDNELKRAFTILNRDGSTTLNMKELSAILPILNETIDATVLREYIRKAGQNFDDELNYKEFQTFVLRGIGRDIICNYI